MALAHRYFGFNLSNSAFFEINADDTAGPDDKSPFFRIDTSAIMCKGHTHDFENTSRISQTVGPCLLEMVYLFISRHSSCVRTVSSFGLSGQHGLTGSKQIQPIALQRVVKTDSEKMILANAVPQSSIAIEILLPVFRKFMRIRYVWELIPATFSTPTIFIHYVSQILDRNLSLSSIPMVRYSPHTVLNINCVEEGTMHEEKQPMIDRSVCSFLSKDRDLKMVGQCISVGISCTHVPDADPVPAPAARHYRKIATLEISGTSPSSRAESATVAAVSISWTELPHQRALPPRSHGERSAALARPADPEESVEACLARLAADPAAAACPRSRRLDRRHREGFNLSCQ